MTDQFSLEKGSYRIRGEYPLFGNKPLQHREHGEENRKKLKIKGVLGKDLVSQVNASG
jgi:hypothetical protein